MANQRGDDQVFIGTWVKSSMAEKIQLARAGQNRSAWVRSAIKKLLIDSGFPVTEEESSAPDRVKVSSEKNEAMFLAAAKEISDGSRKKRKSPRV